MRISIPGPTDVLHFADDLRSAATQALALVPRLRTIVGEVESIVERVRVLIDSIDAVQQRAGDTVSSVDKLMARLEPLIERFEPTLEQLEPIVAHLAETTSPDEVDAMVKLIDQLPTIVDKVETDILPIMDTLGSVAPDLRDLLMTSKELNEIIASIPGLGRMRKRVEHSADR